MHGMLRHFTSNGPVVTDGAWGTLFPVRGRPFEACPESWNLAKPEIVEAAARSFVDSGSQVILTNTFRANRLALAGTESACDCAAINRAGVDISRRAAAGRAAVFASIGPSGKLLHTGEVNVDQLLEAFEEQARVLADAGAEGLVIETMGDIREARAAIAAARKTGLAVIACMVFDSGKLRDRTSMGNTPEEVAWELAEAGADGLGANCVHGVEQCVALCRRLKGATDLPIWIKSDVEVPQIVGGQTQYRTTPAEFAAAAERLVDTGANFVGGCCGTSPEYIAALRQRLRGNREAEVVEPVSAVRSSTSECASRPPCENGRGKG